MCLKCWVQDPIFRRATNPALHGACLQNWRLAMRTEPVEIINPNRAAVNFSKQEALSYPFFIAIWNHQKFFCYIGRSTDVLNVYFSCATVRCFQTSLDGRSDNIRFDYCMGAGWQFNVPLHMKIGNFQRKPNTRQDDGDILFFHPNLQ